MDLRKAGFSPRGAFLSVFPLHTWIRLAGCQMSPPARERGTQSQWGVGGRLMPCWRAAPSPSPA